MATNAKQYGAMRTSIYLIEDDSSVLEFVRSSLAARPEWTLCGASDRQFTAREYAAKAGAAVYLVDLGLPDGRGEDLLQLLSQSNPGAELLVSPCLVMKRGWSAHWRPAPLAMCSKRAA